MKIKIKKLYQTIKDVLKDREKLIIELRFGLDGKRPKTQHQIAKMLGISRSYVSRIETKAIRKISKGNRTVKLGKIDTFSWYLFFCKYFQKNLNIFLLFFG